MVLPEKAFYFCTDIDSYTGKFATSLSSFIEICAEVEEKSLEFHLYRMDFERWVRDVLQEPTLAENITRLREQEYRGQILRERLIEAAKKTDQPSLKSTYAADLQ